MFDGNVANIVGGKVPKLNCFFFLCVGHYLLLLFYILLEANTFCTKWNDALMEHQIELAFLFLSFAG